MIIPYGTDAPVYYWPVGTVVIIALNVIVHGLRMSGAIPPDVVLDLALKFNDGLHPLQWITSKFLHAGLIHLFGNMVFLWIFGLIVEGKLGWIKFLSSYFCMGLVVGAAEQSISILLGQPEYAIGASAIIFGLMGMAMIWAPQNEVRIIWFFYYRGNVTSVSVRNLAIFYIILEGGFAAINVTAGRGITTSFLHTLGLAAGIPLGIVLLKKGLVDCEGWDIFSLRHGKPRAATIYRPGRLEGAKFEESKENALDLMRGYIGDRDPSMAGAVYRQSVSEAGAWPLPQGVLDALLESFTTSDKLSEARPFIEEALARDPPNVVDLTLLLARSFIEGDKDPVKGLEVLFTLPEELSGSQEMLKDRLLDEASRLEAENPDPTSLAS